MDARASRLVPGLLMEGQVRATELQMTFFLLLEYLICQVQIHGSPAPVEEEEEVVEVGRKKKRGNFLHQEPYGEISEIHEAP